MSGEQERDERVRRAMAGLSPRDEELESPPADLWNRIAADVAARPSQPLDGPSNRPASPERRGPSRRRARSLVAAAAVLVVLLGTIVLVVRRDDGGAEVVARVALTSHGLDAPKPAQGTALLEREGKDWLLDVQAADLPSNRPGYFYEVWLLGPGATRVQSLGTLDRDGRFLVPVGIDLRRYPVVDVSIEPIDGNPAHSGKSVLRGNIDLD